MTTTDRDDEKSDFPQKRPGGGGTISITSKKRKKRSIWINLAVVAVTLLIVGGSAFWLTAFTFYTVSSNSMAPALLSTPSERDRLLCWKLAYHYRKPQRWEVAIFESPKNAANRDFIPGMSMGGESGTTVKRIAGLENEELAIAGGDIWTRPLGGQAPFRRMVKPDKIQQGMWINVYRQNFNGVTTEDFLYFWENTGKAPIQVAESRLSMPAGSGIRYLPKARTGYDASRGITVLPGIPDRYVLPQEIFFHCSNCSTVFSKIIDNQMLIGRCPNCGFLNEETAVSLYELRSGLPEVGTYHASDVKQGDDQHFRFNTYQFVGDLRIVMEVKLVHGDSEVRAELSGNQRVATLALGAKLCEINGRAVPDTATAIKPGEWTRVEFYVVDGAVRLYLGDKRGKIFDRVIWSGEKPDTDFDGWESSIALSAAGGDLEIRNLTIDRDVHYFSGRKQGIGNFLAAMSDEGAIAIPSGSFFPLGDNTTVSLDGRSWGAVDMGLLRGVALYIWSPGHRSCSIPTP